jgi:hypothetical protein
LRLRVNNGGRRRCCRGSYNCLDKPLHWDLNDIPPNANVRDITADTIDASGDNSEAPGGAGEEAGESTDGRSDGGELATAANTQGALDKAAGLAVDGKVLAVVLEEGVGAKAMGEEEASAVKDEFGGIGGGAGAGASTDLGEEEGGGDGVGEAV